MRKITIEVMLLEPAQGLDQSQKEKLASNVNAEIDVEGRGGQRVYVRCPYCGSIFQVDLSVLDSDNSISIICPNCVLGSTGSMSNF